MCKEILLCIYVYILVRMKIIMVIFDKNIYGTIAVYKNYKKDK